MTEHAVVIAGSGPTGLMLAGELALAGVDVAIVERRETQDLAGSRAGGMHSRTIELLDQRGIADRFLSEGQVFPVAGFAHIPLDISDIPTRHPYVLGLPQRHIERILADWVTELGVPIQYGSEVTAFEQDDSGVHIRLAEEQSLQSAFLVGCDGGRSLIRRLTGVEFPGWSASTSYLIAEVELSETPELGLRRDENGLHALGKMEDSDHVRLVMQEPLGADGEPTLRDVSEALTAVYGTDFGLVDAASISRFTDMARQAASYRDRRVLLAGDAAHVHSPVGGQGLNLGVQDAANLGWKLAQVVNGTSSAELLDTYQAERHPVAARVLRNTLAQTPLIGGGDRIEAVRETLSELLSLEEARRRFGAMMSGLDIHYDLGEGHPLLGRRMPDLDLSTPDGAVRVFDLLRDARAVLLNLGKPWNCDTSPWSVRVLSIDAGSDGDWELPAVGRVEPPGAVLIRPDGYAAWVGDGTDRGLHDALTAWFGSR